MRVANENLTPNATVAMSSDFELRPIWLGHIANCSIQLVFTGSPAGNFRVQVSNDLGNINAQAISTQDTGVVNWSTINGSTKLIAASGSHTYEFADSGSNWMRVIWDADLGSNGTLTSARAYVKGV